ncbi:MAG: hypothetical protein M3O34_15775 [Chloroflexota bacterium]|nr:hypothetical protein [Chloroflexota bacterium]
MIASRSEVSAAGSAASAPSSAGATAWAAPGGLVLLGAASALVYYTQWTLPWSIWRLWQQPHLDYAFISGYTREGQARYLGSFLLLFALQYVAYRLLRARPASGPLELILIGQAGFGALAIVIYPVAALDLYDYLMYGRIVLDYGGNPFLQPPSAFPDPLVGFSPWPNERSVYGPLWQVISLAPTALSNGSVLAGLLLFKALALLCFVACSVVIWEILQTIAPARAPAGTLLFAWNPLLLFELVGNGHNDVVMVLFLLLAILVLVRGPRLLVFPLLAAAVLTKLPVVALGPAFLLGLLRRPAAWRQRAAWIVGGGLLGLGLAVALYAPFWEGRETLYFLSRGNWFTASLPTMLREYLRQSYPFEEAGRLTATLVGLGFFLFVVARMGLYWRAERRAEAAGSASSVSPTAGHAADAPGQLVPTRASDASPWDAWLSAAHDVTFVYLAFACLWWQPWYLAWLVALAALLPSRLVHERALLFCYGGAINYVVFKYIWPVFQPMTYTQIMGLSVILIFGLPLLHLACTLGLGRLAPRRATGVPAEATA